MRYLTILGIWLLAFFLPQYAGDWYDLRFNVYNALISLFLLFTVLKLSKAWWVPEYCTLLVLQILLNVGDFAANFTPASFDIIAASLNYLELTLIVGFGGLTELYKYGRNRAGHDSDSGPDSPAQCAPSRTGHA